MKKYTKYSLLLMFSIFSETNAQLFTTDDLNTKDYASFYNNLPSVEHAHELKEVRSEPFERFLSSAKDIVMHYELEQSVGVRLIHNHYHVNDTEIMVEKFEEIDGIPSLVTSPSVLRDLDYEVLPTGWIFSTSNISAPNFFEFSTDKAVKKFINKLSSEPEVLTEIGDLIRNHSLEDIIAFGIINREGLTREQDEMFLEINSPEKSRSIVQTRKKFNIPPASIRTSWPLQSPIQHYCFPQHYCEIGITGQHTPKYLSHLYMPSTIP